MRRFNMGNTNKKEIESRLCSFRGIFDSTWIYKECDKELDEEQERDVTLRRIVIPMIQRDYAQGRNVSDIEDIRNAFLDTLYNSLNKDTEIILDFIYGDIDRKGVMTPLDGQQRLTTLFLLHWYASRFSKEPVPENERQFLKRFSYETRADARIFCRELCSFSPKKNLKKLSETITDQPWFLLQWKDDATISSMLVMLDAIHDKFCNLTDIWKKLTEDQLIKFYFLPIRNMGETDDLYIRMNSRGKPLTKFEHFKAELEKCISQIYDKKETDEIMTKIDTKWTNLLWTYCEKNDTNPENAIIDYEFLRYFYFICDILYYKDAYSHKNTIPYTRNLKELKLLSKYFIGNNAKENIKTLVSFFDCWCDIETLFDKKYKTPKKLQESFLSNDHQSGKVKIAYTDIDIFGKCLKAHRPFEEKNPKNSFSLGDTIRLYAITLYLLHKKLLTEDQFVRRFRSVNNLILNSENEVADRTQNSNMPGIIKQTEELILNGTIDKTITGFNTYQVNEEIEKLEFTKHHPNKAELLFELEDHDILRGQIGIIGLDNIDYAKRFESLFKCNLCLVSRALMSIGNYGQRVKKWYCQFGTSSNYAWHYMFHIRQENKDSYIKNTHNVLLQLLSEYEYFDNNILITICDEFIKSCKESSKYPWRYYYVNYKDVFSMNDSSGKYYIENNGNYSYIWIPKTIISKKSHNPFLYKISKDYIWWIVDDYVSGFQCIKYNGVEVYCEHNRYIFRYNNKKITVEINQSNDIDTEDRIAVLKDCIEKINDAVTNNTLDNLFNKDDFYFRSTHH